MSLESKYRRLRSLIRSKKKALVAFSGGVDSSLVAAVAKKTLGDDAVAVTIKSLLLPESELREAIKTAKRIGIKHRIIGHDELGNKSVVMNPPNRCYHCKKEDLRLLKKTARKMRISFVLFGVNADDFRDYRPGNKALANDSKASMPLAEVGLTKKEVRKLARKLGLKNADKPAMACLASRIPYGQEITKEKLRQVEAAEEFLKRDFKIRQIRVRHHEDTARIEVQAEDFPIIIKNRMKIVDKLNKLGFKYIALDLRGYRSGSMNEVL